MSQNCDFHYIKYFIFYYVSIPSLIFFSMFKRWIYTRNNFFLLDNFLVIISRSRIPGSKGTVTYCQINGLNYLNNKIQVLYILWLSNSAPRFISEKLSYVPLEDRHKNIFGIFTHWNTIWHLKLISCSLCSNVNKSKKYSVV